MHGKQFIWLQALDLQKLEWHDTHVMLDLKLSMGDSTLHSVSAVAVVSERQGENHFSFPKNDSAAWPCTVTKLGYWEDICY